MALLNRKVDYAILVLSHLHEHRMGGSAREISERFGLSRAFVANILKELCHKGFVSSHRGVKGGYVIDAGATAVSLGDFIASMDDTFHLAECNHHASTAEPCSISDCCTVRGPIAAVHDRIRNVLRQVTLGELFHPMSGPSLLALPMVGGPVATPVAH
jgi:Rrf2 family cysteine metabolism transcriptional repressor